jgi:hypothetical protein
MKRVVLVCCLILQWCSIAVAQSKEAEAWDLVRVFNASTHVFYGEVIKIVPENDFRTGVMGVAVEDLRAGDLPVQEIVWASGKAVTFSVEDSFKGPEMEVFECYRSDQDAKVWTYVQNDVGDVFLSPPVPLGPELLHLEQTTTGLFFVRYYLGSNLPVIYRVRLGQGALDDLALLRRFEAEGGAASLAQIWQAQQDELQLLAAREAAETQIFEDEYYKILRIRDLEIRRSLLDDLVVRMGYEGRWSFYDFKERYLAGVGEYVDGREQQLIPSEPPNPKEKLWKMVSEELNKIDVILKARSSRQ